MRFEESVVRVPESHFVPHVRCRVVTPALAGARKIEMIEIVALILIRVSNGIADARLLGIALESELNRVVAHSSRRVARCAPDNALPAFIDSRPQNRVVELRWPELRNA